MSNLETLKQQLADHPDHKLLRQAGVIPEELRWEPVVKKKMEYFIEGEKCGVVCTLEFYTYDGGKLFSANKRRMTFPEMKTEEQAKAEFIDDGWSDKLITDFETTAISGILHRLS